MCTCTCCNKQHVAIVLVLASAGSSNTIPIPMPANTTTDAQRLQQVVVTSSRCARRQLSTAILLLNTVWIHSPAGAFACMRQVAYRSGWQGHEAGHHFIRLPTEFEWSLAGC